MARDMILTVDLGGSALKCGLFGGDGVLIAQASIPLAFDESREGWSEQDPALWWRSLLEGFGVIAEQAGHDFDRVAGIALCGFTRTQVLLDRDGRVLRPAIGFRDARAAATVDALLGRPEVATHPLAKRLNVYHPAARLAWVREHEPAVWAAVEAVVEPKDLLALRLTGRVASDFVSQHWMIEAAAGGASSLLQRVGIDAGLLPPILAPEGVVGRVRDGAEPILARLAGVPVFCGSNDSWAAAAGLGALKSGCAYGISGSSEVFGLMAATGAEAEGLLTLPWGPALWQIGGPGLNGAEALRWIVDTVDRTARPFDVRLEALLASPAHDAPLMFLPYLLGERTPYWDRDLRAAFLGLSAGHGPGDMVRAVMQGVAFVNREVLERAERAAGAPADEIRLGGGGARSAVWNQIRADVLGRDIVAMPERQMGLAGCYAVARVGLGLATDPASAIDGAGLDFRRFQPEPASRRRFDTLAPIVRDAHRAVAEISHRLSAVTGNPS